MKKRVTLVLLFMFFACISPVIAQNEAKSLLWRISGKGLAHTSYLYGTFHLRTKKLFDFPDSLYKAIDNTEVFALEVNPDSMNDGLSAYITQLLEEDEVKGKKKKEKKLKDVLTKEERKELKEIIAQNLDIDPDELTPKQIYLMRDKLTKHRESPDDMPTFMDAFLYGIARDKGKMIGGLERFSDQIKLLENPALSDVDPRKVLDLLKKGESVEEQMIRLYLDKDLQKLQELSGVFNEEAEKALLTTRNKVMLRSMDSIMQRHSLFAAVGALHLPGTKGLITLFREKGYTVEPVFCATTTNGADYQFKNDAKGWYTMVNEDAGYSIKMPGKPSDMDAYEGLVKMKTYFDLATSRYFLVSHIPRPEGSKISNDFVIKEMQKTMMKDANDVEIKDLDNNGLKGKEYFFSDKDNNHFHLQLFGSNTNVYMLMAYSSTWNIRSVDSFFKSFRLLAPQPAETTDPLINDPNVPNTTFSGNAPVLWHNSFDVNFSIPQLASFSSDSKYFAMGFDKGNVVVFESGTGNIFTNYHLHSAHVYCTVFQPGGHLLASGDKDGFMVIYDYITGKEIKTVAAHDQVIMAMAFSKDGTLLVTGGKDNTIKFWDPQTGRLLSTINDITGNIISLCITNDNKTIVAGTTALSKGLRLFSATNGTEIKVFESANVQAADLSPDGKYIATANLEKNLLLFDYKRYTFTAKLHGHEKWLTDVVFSPTSLILYSSSQDRTVIAWDVAHLRHAGVIFNSEKKIASIACSPDGKYLAVMDENKTFSIVDISGVEKGK